jgi:hypothetical protein
MVQLKVRLQKVSLKKEKGDSVLPASVTLGDLCTEYRGHTSSSWDGDNYSRNEAIQVSFEVPRSSRKKGGKIPQSLSLERRHWQPHQKSTLCTYPNQYALHKHLLEPSDWPIRHKGLPFNAGSAKKYMLLDRLCNLHIDERGDVGCQNFGKSTKI